MNSEPGTLVLSQQSQHLNILSINQWKFHAHLLSEYQHTKFTFSFLMQSSWNPSLGFDPCIWQVSLSSPHHSPFSSLFVMVISGIISKRTGTLKLEN